MVDPTGEKVEYEVTVDTKNKTVSVVARGTVGVWSSNSAIKPDLNNAAAKIQTQINNGWQGSFKGTGADKGWTFNFKSDIKVQAFDKANSTADVMNTKGGNEMDNIIELDNFNAAGNSSYVHDQRGSKPDPNLNGMKNPDGFSPDTGKWDYPSVVKNEPKHEFTHLQGVYNQGISGQDLTQSPGGVNPTPRRMSQNDFNVVIGTEARSDRDGYMKLRTNVPGTYPAVNTFRHVKYCCK